MSFFKKILLYLYAFYIIYLPDFSFIAPLLSPALVSMLIAVVNLIILNKKLINFLLRKRVGFYFTFIIILTIYVIIINILNKGNISSYISNITFSFNIINYISLFLYITSSYSENRDNNSQNIISFLLRIGIIQAFLIFATPLISGLKNLAINIYIQEGELVDFYSSVLNNRVNGIGASYTFMLPLTQALLASISLLMYRETKTNKYLFFSIILILSSSMNNRTGLYIYLVISFLLILKSLSTKSSIDRKIILIITSILMGVTIYAIFQSGNTRFEWLTEGLRDIVLWIRTGNGEGNMKVLTSSFLKIPEGWNLLFGYGDRTFGEIGRARYNFHSDIGYINDIFKGGLIYIISLYYLNYKFLVSRLANNHFRYAFIIFALIANYKGEVMTGSPILMILLLMSLKYEEIMEENIIDEKNYSFDASL